MADTKISQDPRVTEVANEALIPIVQDGVNKAVTAENLKKPLFNDIVQLQQDVNDLKNKIPIVDENLYYGVQIDENIASPVLFRIGNLQLHRTLPIQSKMRRCLLKDDGTVNYYLDTNDSTKKEDGTDAILDGTDGMVMVEIPQHYRGFSQVGSVKQIMLSEYPLEGFKLIPKCYRSAYEATVERSVNKLASVVNTTPAYRGGNNNSAWDTESRTLLGKPASSISLTNFRAYARNRGNGTKWNCDVYHIQLACYWLYIVEYANLNSQLGFNSALDINGFRQGGLGNGVTDLDGAKWSTFNSYYGVIPCGHTNSLGNNTGVKPYAMPPEYDTTIKTVSVPSYRGIENPFGHLWSWTDGAKERIQSEVDGGLSEFYTCENPDNFQDSNYENYELQGLLPRKEGYIKSLLNENNVPFLVGGGSTTYYCDYFYTNIPATGEAQRGLLFGGYASNGATAGLSSANANAAPSSAAAAYGSRLCFIP